MTTHQVMQALERFGIQPEQIDALRVGEQLAAPQQNLTQTFRLLLTEHLQERARQISRSPIEQAMRLVDTLPKEPTQRTYVQLATIAQRTALPLDQVALLADVASPMT